MLYKYITLQKRKIHMISHCLAKVAIFSMIYRGGMCRTKQGLRSKRETTWFEDCLGVLKYAPPRNK